jgi:hypothetical protein
LAGVAKFDDGVIGCDCSKFNSSVPFFRLTEFSVTEFSGLRVSSLTQATVFYLAATHGEFLSFLVNLEPGG